MNKKQGPAREEESKQAKKTASNREESDATANEGEASKAKERTTQNKTTAEKKETTTRSIIKKIQNWLIALLLIFSLSVMGIGISIFVGTFIPL